MPGPTTSRPGATNLHPVWWQTYVEIRIKNAAGAPPEQLFNGRFATAASKIDSKSGFFGPKSDGRFLLPKTGFSPSFHRIPRVLRNHPVWVAGKSINGKCRPVVAQNAWNSMKTRTKTRLW